MGWNEPRFWLIFPWYMVCVDKSARESPLAETSLKPRDETRILLLISWFVGVFVLWISNKRYYYARDLTIFVCAQHYSSPTPHINWRAIRRVAIGVLGVDTCRDMRVCEGHFDWHGTTIIHSCSSNTIFVCQACWGGESKLKLFYLFIERL